MHFDSVRLSQSIEKYNKIRSKQQFRNSSNPENV